ncbi:MAG: glycoside hydrolase [Anaerolineae bacterium]
MNRSETQTLENASLAVSFDPQDGTLSVRDKRTDHVWSQSPARGFGRLRDVRTSDRELIFVWQEPGAPELEVVLALEPSLPELTVTLSAEGPLPGPLAFPHPFVTEEDTYLVIPMNEGISYPVGDTTIETRRFAAYAGHSGISMAFWGVTDGEQGHMAIIETPDDAAIRVDRTIDQRLYVAPEFDAQKGTFGYTRRLRYVFFDAGGYVAMCKRYRAYAQEQGLLKTMAEKRDVIPAVDLLVGAVNVWCWEDDPLPIVKEMQSLGIDRILWSASSGAETIAALNELGVVTSTYDIIQDVMNPAMYDRLRFRHRRWPEAAWPDDLMIGADGDWTKGWRISLKDGSGKYPCGAVCDRQAPKYARERISEELETLPYRCRFIDTTTATPWRECYSLEHPMTRTESREWKMELLRLVWEEYDLITGCETGHEAAVPHVHYFEGMLSLAHYRVPDAGRRMREIWYDVPERVERFQLGHDYRLPLWELVYHDCVASHWYWGDYNNKLPALWDKRDLLNVLYGTVPMFMFDPEFWKEHRERFAQSYRTTCPVARAVGYSEMIDHRFLTDDRGVQQTEFANGVTVTVNFTEDEVRLADNAILPPMSSRVEGLRASPEVETS